MEVLVDGVDARGVCVGRHAGQAPEVDSVCYLTEPKPTGTLLTGEVVDWDEYDLIVRPAGAAPKTPPRRRGKRARAARTRNRR